MRFALCLLGLAAASSGCEAIAGLGERSIGAAPTTAATGGGGGAGGATCTSQGGAPVCDADYADCDGCFENGCEVKLSDDPLNCGRCGRFCGEGIACGFSHCEPEKVEAQHNYGTLVYAMATDEQHVYLAYNGMLVSVVKDVPSPIAPLTGNVGEVSGIAVLGGNVYFSVLFTGEIKKVPVLGGNVVTLATLPIYLNQLVADDAAAYVADHGTPGYVARIPIDGKPSVMLHQGGPHSGVAVDDKRVYFTTGGELLDVDKLDGSTPTTLVPKSADPQAALSGSLGVDADSVFYTTKTALMKIPKGGGAPVSLLGELLGAGPVLVDDKRAYFWTSFSGGPGDIYSVDKDGSKSLKIAVAQPYPQAAGFTMDDKYVYWISPAGYIVRTPK